MLKRFTSIYITQTVVANGNKSDIWIYRNTRQNFGGGGRGVHPKIMGTSYAPVVLPM